MPGAEKSKQYLQSKSWSDVKKAVDAVIEKDRKYHDDSFVGLGVTPPYPGSFKSGPHYRAIILSTEVMLARKLIAEGLIHQRDKLKGTLFQLLIYATTRNLDPEAVCRTAFPEMVPNQESGSVWDDIENHLRSRDILRINPEEKAERFLRVVDSVALLDNALTHGRKEEPGTRPAGEDLPLAADMFRELMLYLHGNGISIRLLYEQAVVRSLEGSYRIKPDVEVPDVDYSAIRGVLTHGLNASEGVDEGVLRLCGGTEDVKQALERGDKVLLALGGWERTLPFYLQDYLGSSTYAKNLAGVVIEKGGIGQHPMIVAREFGIPAIVAAKIENLGNYNGKLVRIVCKGDQAYLQDVSAEG